MGIVDSGVDLGHPSLNTTSTGERKIVDWVTFTDPGFTGGVNNDDDPTWIDMSNPAPGQPATFRYGLFNERDPRLGGELGNDVNRDGNPAGSIGTFGVLWDTATNTVWVDTNQNKNFADDKPMTDYKVNKDIGKFGTDNPATAVAESMPFVVQTSPDTNSVNIGIVSGEHGSHVAGIVAGNKLFGGKMSGAAPGAKLVSVRACLFVSGCTSHALDEGMIYAVQEAGVDVINMSIGGLDLVNEGNTARELLYNRLIDENDVQMFISAGNDGAGLNTTSQPSLGSKVMGVGSYISKAVLAAQLRFGRGADRTTCTRSRGAVRVRTAASSRTSSRRARPSRRSRPGSRAGRSPARTRCRRATRCCRAPRWPRRRRRAPRHCCVSAAMQKNVSHHAASCARRSTPRPASSDNYQAYEQGNGLIDVQEGLEHAQGEPREHQHHSAVRCNTVLSDFLHNPGVGTRHLRPGGRHARRQATPASTRSPAPPAPTRPGDLQGPLGRQRRRRSARRTRSRCARTARSSSR